MEWTDSQSWELLVLPGPRHQITGKYLFFSESAAELRSIAERECSEHGFFLAKISKVPASSEHVMCLYWFNDNRKHELANRHKNHSAVKYRYWKSDAATLSGEYSRQFLESCLDEDGEEIDEDRPY